MNSIDWLVIGLYLIGTLFLGFSLHKKASENIDAFFLGNRQIPWWALGASGMASNIDVAGTMVISALVYTLGTKGLYIEMRGGMVLVLAFFMAFLGKWTRRAQVMTAAEWMKLRFGTGREGKIARLMSASANLISHIWIISYFAVGGGKFFGLFLGIGDQWASVLMIVITLLYATASGFYGVVWTDVFQGSIILIGILYLVGLAWKMPALPDIFSVSIPTGKGTFEQIPIRYADWGSIFPPKTMDLPGNYSIYNLFGITIFFYFLKTSIEGFGGAGGYMSQRYCAAKSDREAGLLTAFWIFLLSFRWPLVTAIAILAIHHSITHGPLVDPELALPLVIMNYAPVGMKGLLVACFMAAAMSTFVAIINASAAYWVKDIYQAYINPQASEKKLLVHSRWASILIVVLGLGFSLPVVNINDIWGWLTMAFGAGLFVPLLLRWYWWRYSGYGFAWGTAAGMLSAIFVRYSGISVPEYMNFVIPGSCSLMGCILGTYLCRPTEPSIVRHFYEVTRPFGFWGPIRALIAPDLQKKIRRENRNDIWATIFAVPWMITLSLWGMLLVMKRWDHFAYLSTTLIVLSVGLYFVWYKNLEEV